MWEAIGLCAMFGSLALLFGVVVPLAHYQTYHGPSPIQKELDELNAAREKLAVANVKLQATMDAIRNHV